jgi:hypothetical protein
VLFSILYLILRGMLRLVPAAEGGREREIEILVLRHQLKVLSRKAGRPMAASDGPSLLGQCIQDALARALDLLPSLGTPHS